jgi:mannose-6-phosphate isomerase-like protein (cupin superfamily)
MEVITSLQEMTPSDVGTLHTLHGEESFYFIEGGMVETPDGKQVPIQTGTVGIDRRAVPHGAFKVIGDKPLKFITVHLVDKGAPYTKNRNRSRLALTAASAATPQSQRGG